MESFESIRTNNEEDTQKFVFKSFKINSCDELENEINRIGKTIETIETNWQSRVQSIQQIGNILCGDILNKYPNQFINLLSFYRDGICKQITELRSGVTKEIFRVLSYLAISIDENNENISLKQQIQPFIDYIIPYILKQTKQTILVISHHSNITLRTIIKRIPISKSINHLIQNTNINQQKSICLRVRCIEYIRILIETQSYHNHYLQRLSIETNIDYISLINNSIIKCISDPHQSVRYVARQCVWSLNKIYPNNKYSSYILSKISSQNAKYVMSEKLQYKMLPPPIGTGHKVELGKNNNKGLIQSSSSSSSSINITTKPSIMQRPKSALPSRKHRLELLKKKKREMASKLRKQTINNNNDNNNTNNNIIVFAQKRPQTAHTPHQIGLAHRRICNDEDYDDDDDDDDTQDIIMKNDKISIMGNATRFSSSDSMTRITPSSFQRNLNDILLSINDDMNLQRIYELSKWLQSNDNNHNNIEDISSILLSIGGVLDFMVMNKSNKPEQELFIKAIIECINNLILSSSMMSIQDLLHILSKLLRLFICSNAIEYEKNYNQYNQYFECITKSLLSNQCDGFSLKSLIKGLSQTIIKPKQKLIWLHFISCYCKQSQIDSDWNIKLLIYLFNFLKECIINPQFIEFHSLFRSQNCLIIDDIIKYIIYQHNNVYNDIFKSQLNDNTIETLLGIIKNQSVIQILQKYYSIHSNTNHNNNANNNNNNNKYLTPSHQNKKYQRIRKIQIETMSTPPLNMYMTTPLQIAKKYNQKENNLNNLNNFNNLNDLNDEQLINIILSNNKMDEKLALKYLSHRINGDKIIFEEKCKDILLHIIDNLNDDKFILHRNSLRILQAICWFYPKYINKNLEITLKSIINLFRKTAPTESGELALDVITQFCKIVDRESCLNYLLQIIKNELNNINDNNGRKMFAALSIFDRIIVLSSKEWLMNKINSFTEILISVYKYYREAMRSLIYLSIILNNDTSFLNKYSREKKIVEMMCKENDFIDWVKSHRINE